MRMTRRVLLGGAAAAASVVVMGAVGYTQLSDVEIARATLKRLVGDFDMPDMAAFTADFKNVFPSFGGVRASMISLIERTGAADLAETVSPAMGAKVESFERALLTHFVTKTDFLEMQVAGKPVQVTYRGPSSACVNPFAQFV